MTFTSALMGGLGTGLASGIMGKLNPGPKPLSGRQAGQRDKEYFSELYNDELNPWELAGAGGHGAIGS